MIEQFVDEGGRVREREVRPDADREVAVGRVVSLNPPLVNVEGHGPIRVQARTVGLRPVVGDWVCVARVAQGVVVLSIVEVL